MKEKQLKQEQYDIIVMEKVLEELKYKYDSEMGEGKSFKILERIKRKFLGEEEDETMLPPLDTAIIYDKLNV